MSPDGITRISSRVASPGRSGRIREIEFNGEYVSLYSNVPRADDGLGRVNRMLNRAMAMKGDRDEGQEIMTKGVKGSLR